VTWVLDDTLGIQGGHDIPDVVAFAAQLPGALTPFSVLHAAATLAAGIGFGRQHAALVAKPNGFWRKVLWEIPSSARPTFAWSLTRSDLMSREH
jgi:hypothetical protein